MEKGKNTLIEVIKVLAEGVIEMNLDGLNDEDVYKQFIKNSELLISMLNKAEVLQMSFEGKIYSGEKLRGMSRVTAMLFLLYLNHSVTGAISREAFQCICSIYEEEQRKQDVPFTLIYMDVNYFKQINDTFGHQIGDEVLKYVGESLKDLFRTADGREDTVASYGGDEFIVALQSCREDDARKIVERVEQFFERPFISSKGNKINIALSYGIQEYDLSLNYYQNIDIADKNMYSDKTSKKMMLEREKTE